MKVKYVLAKSDVDLIPVLKKALPVLKDNVGIITTIQYLHLMENVKKFLEKNKIKAEILGQVLGCNVDVTKNSKVNTFLYIGDGLFHPKAMLREKKKVIIANPISLDVKELGEKEIEEFEKIKYRGLAKFHSSINIGVLVTTKLGQENLKQALNLREKYKTKNFYILLFDTLDFSSLEDFNFIDCFVNTMCPRISYDDANKLPKAVVDISDLN
jgi:diphthamide biosynthesis enzyme Dph1/Dph2-like protein